MWKYQEDILVQHCAVTGENEASVRWLLDRYPDAMRLVSAQPRVGGPGLVGRHPLGFCRRTTLDISETSAAHPVHEGSNLRGGSATAARLGSVQLPLGHSAEGRAAGCGPGAGAGQDLVMEDEVWLTEEEAVMVQRFDPAGEQDTIGFFVSAFEKVG
jgi:hypothetical protein